MPPTIADAEQVLSRWFGYAALRPPQRRAIVAVLNGRDVLVVMPTGGGKSLCFQVPALLVDGLTIVLSPLVSLMKDQVDTLVRKGIPAAGLHGGMTPGEQADAIAHAICGTIRMLYVAPERLVAGKTLSALCRVKVGLLAVDEAHCISEWGHEFRPAYRELMAIRGPLGMPPAIALTATATPDVRDDIAKVCGLRAPVRITAGFDRPNLHYGVHRVGRARERTNRLVDLVAAREGPAVVYAQTRSRVERLAALLVRAGVPAVPYHAGQLQDLRRRTQDRFMRGEADVIVATSAFGMGVDKPDVRLVVHDAISASLESYYQEAGRAGRDGKPSRCLLLYARADRRSPDYFIRSSSPSRATIEAVYAAAVHSCGQAPAAAWIDVAAVARRAKVPPAEVHGAMGVLGRAGAVIDERGESGRVWVRIIATADRIASIYAADSAERALLRAMWRLSRDGLRAGTTIDVGSLPPGLGAVGLVGTLDALMRSAVIIWERPAAGLRLVDPCAPLARWPVDWEAIAARRRVAQRRLEAMIRYAESRSCRRRVLLGYFGDDVAGGRCGGCDRCA